MVGFVVGLLALDRAPKHLSRRDLSNDHVSGGCASARIPTFILWRPSMPETKWPTLCLSGLRPSEGGGDSSDSRGQARQSLGA